MLFDIDSGTDPDEIDLGDCKNSICTLGAASSLYVAMMPLPVNNIKWTFSCWVKRSTLGAATSIFGTSTVLTNVNAGNIGFNTSNQLIFATSTGYWNFITNRVFIDTSAWMYLQINYDSAQAVAANRIKVYVNGAQELDFATATYPTINRASTINAVDQPHQIGFSGEVYLANVCFIDGASLDPSYFGSKSTEYNEWRPKNQSDLAVLCSSYGGTSFLLTFNDATTASALGTDASTNGNNWTVSGYTVTGSGTNWFNEGPGRPYATLSRVLGSTASTVSGKGLVYSGTTTAVTVTTAYPIKTKVYFECVVTGTIGNARIGIASVSRLGAPGADFSSFGWDPSTKLVYCNNTSLGSTVSSTAVAGDVLRIAYDPATQYIWFGVNGAWYWSYTPGVSGGTRLPGAQSGIDADAWYICVGNSSTVTITCNFGQRPFSYSKPAGFSTLCTLNNPPVEIKNPSKHFDVLLDTGANIKAAADARYPNSIQWIKDRANTANWQMCDSVRGLNNALKMPSVSGGQVSFSNPVGASVAYVFNTVTDPAVNNQGTIATMVSGNTVAGISAMLYTTVGAVGGVTTYGHGAGKRPDFVLAKLVGSGTLFGWPTWTNAGQGRAEFYQYTFDRLATPVSSGVNWASPAWSSTLISYDLNSDAHYKGYDPGIAYCFAEIPGFLCMRQYGGNASIDGAFVYLGFRPKLVIIKAVSSYTTGNWTFVDSVRSPGNYVNESLSSNTTGAEVVATSSTGAYIQFLSNGFKVCSTHADVNASGVTYSVLAIADVADTYALAR